MENSSEEEDIDNLLDQEDPEFRKDLSEVAEVQPEVELDDEGSIDEFSDSDFEEDEEEPQSRFKKLMSRAKKRMAFRFGRLKVRAKNLIFQLLIVLKTKPKEILGFLLAHIKVGLTLVKSLIGRFTALPRSQKAVVLVVFTLSLAVGLLTFKNLKGVWIPSLNPPVVYTMADVANETFQIKGGEAEMFYKAFPRSPDLFLFDKFKVNLKPSGEHPNPMGAFEVVLELDSKDAAIEVQSRKVEFHDLIQREFEAQTYPSMLTELGKQHLKNQIKNSLDPLLSQGWVEDIHFQTFILKP